MFIACSLNAFACKLDVADRHDHNVAVNLHRHHQTHAKSVSALERKKKTRASRCLHSPSEMSAMSLLNYFYFRQRDCCRCTYFLERYSRAAVKNAHSRGCCEIAGWSLHVHDLWENFRCNNSLDVCYCFVSLQTHAISSESIQTKVLSSCGLYQRQDRLPTSIVVWYPAQREGSVSWLHTGLLDPAYPQRGKLCSCCALAKDRLVSTKLFDTLTKLKRWCTSTHLNDKR